VTKNLTTHLSHNLCAVLPQDLFRIFGCKQPPQGILLP
jgi:hypothetical protein